MSKKDKNLERKLEKAKEILKEKFKEYIEGYPKEHHNIIWSISKNSSTYSHLVENQNISEAFLCFVDGVEQYTKWRSKLNNEHILAIYIKNLEDRQKYYASSEFDEFKKSYLEK